jgi:hypothetical protein
VGVRGLLANQIESGRLAAEDLLQEWQEKNHGAEHGRMADPSGTALTEEDLGAPPHTRAHHEPCIVPTVPQHRLTTGSRRVFRVLGFQVYRCSGLYYEGCAIALNHLAHFSEAWQQYHRSVLKSKVVDYL